jgi:hypothetical protein
VEPAVTLQLCARCTSPSVVLGSAVQETQHAHAIILQGLEPRQRAHTGWRHGLPTWLYPSSSSRLEKRSAAASPSNMTTPSLKWDTSSADARCCLPSNCRQQQREQRRTMCACFRSWLLRPRVSLTLYEHVHLWWQWQHEVCVHQAQLTQQLHPCITV